MLLTAHCIQLLSIGELDNWLKRACKSPSYWYLQLVPGLKSTEECVQVPKEVCGTSRINPRKVERPSIMNWCYSPDCQNNTDCAQGFLCQDGRCLRDPGLCSDDTDCGETDICEAGHCVPGNSPTLREAFICGIRLWTKIQTKSLQFWRFKIV